MNKQDKAVVLALWCVAWLALFVGGAMAQTPNPVTPGYQICNTSDPGNTHCSWQPVDATHPLPTSGGGSGGGAVTIVNGGDVAQGSTTDAPAATPTTVAPATDIALQKAIVNAVISSIPAGNNLIGQVGIDQTSPGSTNAVSATGNVASGAADAGSPVKIGCVNNTTLPTVTTGERVDCQSDTRGAQYVVLKNVNATQTATILAIANDTTPAQSGLYVNSQPTIFDGINFPRQFSCPNSAVVNVTGGTTVQLVALSGTTTIRVCSFAITSSIAGTAQFQYGTGTACATGTTNITGAMTLGTTVPMALSAGNGSLFRAASANALCLAAGTGNVTGFISYVQF